MKDYALWRLRDKPGQRTLSAFAAQPLSRSAPAQAAASAHLPAWSPAATSVRPGLSPGLGAADVAAPEQPGHEHGPAGSSAQVHVAADRTAEEPLPAVSGGLVQEAALDQGAGRSVDVAAPAPLVSSSRELSQAHEAAALRPLHGALQGAWQGGSGSNVEGLAAMVTAANSPGAQCAVAGPQHVQAQPAVQQHSASPVAELLRAPAPQAAGQLPACEAPALAGAAGPAVWDGPAWPGEIVPMEKQAPPSTAARAASGAAPGAAAAGAAAGAERPDSGAGPCAERTDPGPGRGCSSGSPGDGREGESGGDPRAAEGPTSTSRPTWSLSQPSQGGFGGDARAHDVSVGASPGWRTGTASAEAAGTRPGSAHMRIPEAAVSAPPDRGAWSSPESHAGSATGLASAGQGAHQQAGGGAQRGAVQPRANPNPGPPVGARTAEQISAAARAAKDILKGPPRSSRDDPAFQQTFWQASRLHFIGSWKARACSLGFTRNFHHCSWHVQCWCLTTHVCEKWGSAHNGLLGCAQALIVIKQSKTLPRMSSVQDQRLPLCASLYTL